jgi:hypothetical protein
MNISRCFEKISKLFECPESVPQKRQGSVRVWSKYRQTFATPALKIRAQILLVRCQNGFDCQCFVGAAPSSFRLSGRITDREIAYAESLNTP